MGSTNRPDVLDPAPVRPGRFDQLIQVNPPDKAGRREIVRGYLQGVTHDDSVDVEAIVADTSKSTPAQIMAALTKDAVRIALFAGRTRISQKDIERAFLQQWMGIENPIEEMAPDQRRQIAVHEAGHAVAQHTLLPDQRIVHLTIVARAQSLGFILPLDQVEMYSYPLRRIVADIMVGMAGHIATRVVFGEDWTGAYSDFQQVRGHLRHLQSLGYFGPPIRLIALADALLKRSSLSSDEVLAILDPAAAALATADGTPQDGPGTNGKPTPVAAPSCTELDLIPVQ